MTQTTTDCTSVQRFLSVTSWGIPTSLVFFCFLTFSISSSLFLVLFLRHPFFFFLPSLVLRRRFQVIVFFAFLVFFYFPSFLLYVLRRLFEGSLSSFFSFSSYFISSFLHYFCLRSFQVIFYPPPHLCSLFTHPPSPSKSRKNVELCFLHAREKYLVCLTNFSTAWMDLQCTSLGRSKELSLILFKDSKHRFL